MPVEVDYALHVSVGLNGGAPFLLVVLSVPKVMPRQSGSSLVPSLRFDIQ